MSRQTKLNPCYVNRRVVLPYALKVEEIEQAVAETYRLFHGLNDFLENSGFRPLEELLLGIRYAIGAQGKGASTPLTFLEILCARLDEADWSFSGRIGASRRTPTASITAAGVEKLRNNFLYRLPDVGIGRHRAILAEP